MRLNKTTLHAIGEATEAAIGSNPYPDKIKGARGPLHRTARNCFLSAVYAIFCKSHSVEEMARFVGSATPKRFLNQLRKGGPDGVLRELKTIYPKYANLSSEIGIIDRTKKGGMHIHNLIEVAVLEHGPDIRLVNSPTKTHQELTVGNYFDRFPEKRPCRN